MHLARALHLAAALGITACAATAPTVTSSGLMAPALRLEQMAVYFDPKYEPGPASGDTHIAIEGVPRVRILAAALSPPFMATFPAVLSRHGVAVVEPADTVPLLYVRVQTFSRRCVNGEGCDTHVLIAGDLVKEKASLWSFTSWMAPAYMDLDKFREFEESIAQAMAADGVIGQQTAP